MSLDLTMRGDLLKEHHHKYLLTQAAKNQKIVRTDSQGNLVAAAQIFFQHAANEFSYRRRGKSSGQDIESPVLMRILTAGLLSEYLSYDD